MWFFFMVFCVLDCGDGLCFGCLVLLVEKISFKFCYVDKFLRRIM